MFARYVFWLKDLCFQPSEINFIINGLNQMITEPLEQQEIDTILRTKGCL